MSRTKKLYIVGYLGHWWFRGFGVFPLPFCDRIMYDGAHAYGDFRLHLNRPELDGRSSDQLAERVVSIVTLYPLREIIKKRISMPLSSKIDLDDVLQEVLLAVFHGTESEEVFRMHAAGELRAWLTTLIRRNVAGVIRKLNAKKRSGGINTYGENANKGQSRLALLDVICDEGRSPSSVEAATEAKDAMQVALSSLPVVYRQALTLHYLEGIPHKEVASIMKRSAGSVHGLLHRGVRMLRARMGPADRWFSKVDSADDYLWRVFYDTEESTKKGDP